MRHHKRENVGDVDQVTSLKSLSATTQQVMADKEADREILRQTTILIQGSNNGIDRVN